MTARITRRGVLAALAAVPVAGGLAAVGLRARWWDRPPGEGLVALSTDEHDFLQALAEAWLPPGGEPAISGSEAQVGAFLDQVVGAMSKPSARELKLLLQALDDWPIPRRLRPFRLLPLEVRADVVNGWLLSDQWLIRNAALGVLVLVGEAYSMHPDVVPGLRALYPCGFGP